MPGSSPFDLFHVLAHPPLESNSYAVWSLETGRKVGGGEEAGAKLIVKS